MNENREIILTIYKDSEMAAFSCKNLLEDLKDKRNKIKETVLHILEGYERYQKDALEYLDELCVPKQTEGKMTKIASKLGIQKEVKSDNSDSAIAEMLIQGISMGCLSMEQKLNASENHLEKKYKKFAQDFLKFQQENITALKKEL